MRDMRDLPSRLMIEWVRRPQFGSKESVSSKSYDEYSSTLSISINLIALRFFSDGSPRGLRMLLPAPFEDRTFAKPKSELAEFPVEVGQQDSEF
jgi:hypothetical protein